MSFGRVVLLVSLTFASTAQADGRECTSRWGAVWTGLVAKLRSSRELPREEIAKPKAESPQSFEAAARANMHAEELAKIRARIAADREAHEAQMAANRAAHEAQMAADRAAHEARMEEIDRQTEEIRRRAKEVRLRLERNSALRANAGLPAAERRGKPGGRQLGSIGERWAHPEYPIGRGSGQIKLPRRSVLLSSKRTAPTSTAEKRQ